MSKSQTDSKWVAPTVAAIAFGLIGFLLGWAWQQPVTVQSCTSLSLSEGDSDGTAGTVYKYAVITNTGTTTCTLTGFPTVFMQDSSGAKLGDSAVASMYYTPTTVTLEPGGKAHSVVSFAQIGNYDDPGVCSALSSSMEMYVPGLETPLVASWSDYNCPGFSATALQPGDGSATN